MTTRSQRLQLAALALGGAAFIAGGITHPSDSGTGTKTDQLHDMLIAPAWYPSHVLLVAGIAGFTLGALALRGRGSPAMQRLTAAVSVISAIAVVGMTVHLFQAVNAGEVADGQENLFSQLQVVNETVLNTVWSLSFAVLALVGGLTRTVGNVVTAALGLVGGGAFALASATIAFTDRFDVLFPVGALLGLWAIAVGSWEAVSERRVSERPAAHAR
jgi:ABC-type branched-subunit amino acid transport system permease subunit